MPRGLALAWAVLFQDLPEVQYVEPVACRVPTVPIECQYSLIVSGAGRSWVVCSVDAAKRVLWALEREGGVTC